MRRALILYGPDLGSLKEKTTRRKPPRVETSHVTPPLIEEHHKNVTLGMDVMHVNGMMLLVTTSRNIKFSTIDAIPNKDERTLLQSISKTVSIFQGGGLRPRFLHADAAFVKDELKVSLGMLGVTLNITAREEHVGDVKQTIRTVKERIRCVYNISCQIASRLRNTISGRFLTSAIRMPSLGP